MASQTLFLRPSGYKSLPSSEFFEGLFLVFAPAGDGGAEVEAGAGNETRDDGRAGPRGNGGTICAEKGLARAADGDAEYGRGRHGGGRAESGECVVCGVVGRGRK